MGIIPAEDRQRLPMDSQHRFRLPRLRSTIGHSLGFLVFRDSNVLYSLFLHSLLGRFDHYY